MTLQENLDLIAAERAKIEAETENLARQLAQLRESRLVLEGHKALLISALNTPESGEHPCLSLFSSEPYSRELSA